VQVDPIIPTLKAHGIKRLKLKCDKLLSSFAFHFNLRRYTVGRREWNLGGWKVKDIGVVVVGTGNAARHVIHYF